MIEQLSTATGIRQITLMHTARLLRGAKGELWPRSGKGGGKSARHVEPRHLANLILALAGAQPSDATRVIAKLGVALWAKEGRASRAAADAYPLSSRGLLTRQDKGRLTDFDLRTMLEVLIQTVAMDKALTKVGKRSKWTLWLNPDAGVAWVSWTDDQNKEHREMYVPAQPSLLAPVENQSSAIVERLVKIPFALIATAADLCADTMAHGDATSSKPIQGRLLRGQLSRSPPKLSCGQPSSRQTRGRSTLKR